LLADISHELRSPLTRLQLAVSLAERELQSDNSDSPETLRLNLARIEQESTRLESLVAQLLALTRLESGQQSLRSERIDLNKLLTEVVNDASFEASAQHKKVLLGGETSGLELLGERALLRSALDNVVRNAVRHTPENSLVEISVHRKDSSATIRVCDAGEGVRPEHLPRLFEPFFRADEARTHDAGVGLGLSITRRAAESLGGSVRAFNRDWGGLCVELLLPLTPVESTVTLSSPAKS
jgi:two-component system sensor histidine kinase CpxA